MNVSCRHIDSNSILTSPDRAAQILSAAGASYYGNQLSGLADGAPTVLLESSLDMPQGNWSSGFYHDCNGNMVSDPSRGILVIYYNPLNLPTAITMESGIRFNYLYSAAGAKLAEIIYDVDDTVESPTMRRDYAGIFEYSNSALARISLASGYITPSTEPMSIDPTHPPFTPINPEADAQAAEGAYAESAADTDGTVTPLPGFPKEPTFPVFDRSATYHLYAFDYQGNVVGVYNTKTGSLEQTTDYYPYGLPHASASSYAPYDRNLRLYSAKELATEAGLNSYDFAARWLSPAFPRFTSPDPLAEKYQRYTCYTYCGGDPLNRIDPLGLAWLQNLQSGKVIWNKDVTCEDDTPKGYAYIGMENNDILRFFGFQPQQQRQSKSGRGYTIWGDLSCLGLPTMSKTVIYANIDVSAETDNGENIFKPKTFKGISIKGFVTQRIYNTIPGLSLQYEGGINLMVGGIAYSTPLIYNYEIDNGYRNPGEIYRYGELFIPAENLTIPFITHLKYLNINLGAVNSQLLITFPVSFNFR